MTVYVAEYRHSGQKPCFFRAVTISEAVDKARACFDLPRERTPVVSVEDGVITALITNWSSRSLVVSDTVRMDAARLAQLCAEALS